MNTEQDRVDVRGTVSFVAIAYVPAWLLTLPMWITGQGLLWQWAPLVLTAMMFMPAVATFVVSKWVSPKPDLLRATGIRSPGGFRSWWRYSLVAWLGPPVVMLLALLVGDLLGVYHADWTGFSGLAEQNHTEVIGEPETSPNTLALTEVAQVFLLGWFNVAAAFGEEWGWRGYLLPNLIPLGQPGAFLVTGVLWGLWHAPVLVLGYNYPTVPVVVSFIMMVCFCTLVGVLLGWLRLVSRSVWPPAIAHGFLNASAGLPLIFVAAGNPINNAHVGLLSWSGWIVLILLIVLLVLLRKLPVKLEHVPDGLTRGVRRLSRR
ncbi:CPBP family intramembrane glutamic endopeptidase [Parasphingorhabdus pacifica]